MKIGGKVNTGSKVDAVLPLFSNRPMALLPQVLMWAEYVTSTAVFNNFLRIMTKQLLKIEMLSAYESDAREGRHGPYPAMCFSKKYKREMELKWSNVPLKSHRPRFEF